MVADERVAGRGNEGARASEKFDGRHQPMGLSAAATHLHLVSNPAVGQSRKPFECEAGAERVAAEFLAPLDVDGWDSDASVKIEMGVLGCEALLSLAPTSFVVIGGEDLRAGRAEPAGGEGHLRTSLEWARGFCLVRNVLVCILVKKALTSKPANHACGSFPDNALKILWGWRRSSMKATRFTVEREDAVDPDDVQVGIQIQAASESLDAGDGAGSRGRDARATDIVGGHDFEEDASDCRQHVGTECHEAPKLEGKGQDPLAHRNVRYHAVDQVSRRVAHSTSGTTRTDAAIFAREGDQKIVAAAVAVTAHETARKDAAPHVVAKLVLDVARHGPFVSLACEREKGLEVLAHDVVQDGRFRPSRARWISGTRGGRAALVGARHCGGRLRAPCRSPRATISVTWRSMCGGARQTRPAPADSQLSQSCVGNGPQGKRPSPINALRIRGTRTRDGAHVSRRAGSYVML